MPVRKRWYQALHAPDFVEFVPGQDLSLVALKKILFPTRLLMQKKYAPEGVTQVIISEQFRCLPKMP
ncbi:hypothetical protein Pelo_7884 [Pelomyxa schiedti]|nr:hypothetical protein Pelo_7884 [Pelomyxa schiedti]